MTAKKKPKNENKAPLEPQIESGEVVASEEDELSTLPEVASTVLPEVIEEDGPAEDTKSPVTYDSFQAYLNEIGRYPSLSREEEYELAVKLKENQDIDSARTLVHSNLWLVVKIAREYERAARSILDLVQEGNIGLMEAVKNFDPYRGVRLPSYASWWIRAYIIRYVIANWRLVKIGTTQAQRKLFFNLQKEREKLEREGFFATPKLLAERLDVREADVNEMEQRLSHADLSVDAPLQTGDDSSDMLSVLPAEGQNAEDMVIQHEMRELLADKLDEFGTSLKSNERLIFKDRILAEEKRTLQEIADELDISAERVRQLETRIKGKLKEFLREDFGESIDSQ